MRRANRIEKLIRQANFPIPNASIEELDYSAGRGINQVRMRRYATHDWKSDATNVLITSPTGERGARPRGQRRDRHARGRLQPHLRRRAARRSQGRRRAGRASASTRRGTSDRADPAVPSTHRRWGPRPTAPRPGKRRPA
ncbi:MAG: ATP-binding protein [Trueperaceae bacterium]|nr:ATP-binding protein [Trueperaceae bacterium]